MFWQEDENNETLPIPDDIIDLAFTLTCRELPVDHGYALGSALIKALPLLGEDERIAIHSIYLAGSQNGWARPDPDLGQKLILSKRTRLTLRIPKEHQATIQDTLQGVTLDIDGHTLAIGQAKSKPLSRQDTLFARYIVLHANESKDENSFLERIMEHLKSRKLNAPKALCGTIQHLHTPAGLLATRSLMLAGLTASQTIPLQQQYIGQHHHMGCGIFIPHKGIEAIQPLADA